jgi:hypothetical protein
MKNLKVLTIMLNVTMKIKILRMKLLKAFHQNTKTRIYKLRKVMKMTHLNLNE